MKVCTKCGASRQISAYSKDRSKPDGRHSQCKLCHRAHYEAMVLRRTAEEHQRAKDRSRQWRLDNPKRASRTVRNATLKKKYGITADEYDRMFSAQGNSCAICGRSEHGGNGAFHVDHDHKTGKIRAILCQGCNTSLGHMNEDPSLLRKAATYLEEHGHQNPIS